MPYDTLAAPASILLGLVLALALLSGCGGEEEPPPAPIEREKDWTPLVDGTKILERVRRICEIGPRPPGSDGIASARIEIAAQLSRAGIASKDIVEQRFTMPTPEPETDGETEFVNLIARLPGKSPQGIAIAAHYDSKLMPGFEFVGANDAASACAAVIEIARYLVDQEKESGEPAPWTTWFVFFDGEEAFKQDWNEAPGHHTYGSRYLAENLEGYPFVALILLDMIGTRDIILAEDTANSDPQLIGIFKETSREILGYNLLARPVPLVDDHLSFKNRVPAIDLIDHAFERSTWWHTAEDVVDLLSARSLEKVTTLVLHALPKVWERFRPR
jgi:hypothetical protein